MFLGHWLRYPLRVNVCLKNFIRVNNYGFGY